MSNPAVASAWGKRTASLKACLQKPLARPRLFGLGFGRLLCEAFDLGEAFDLAYPGVKLQFVDRFYLIKHGED
jgi:hypothetical protein